MLVPESKILNERDGILSFMADGFAPKEIGVGMYEVGHFGGGMFMEGYEHYPELGVNPYGVVDHPQQLLGKAPEILRSAHREFVCVFTKVSRSEQPSAGGWRWHKWGPYIGNREPTCEYLHDEPEIEHIYVYHIYERV